MRFAAIDFETASDRRGSAPFDNSVLASCCRTYQLPDIRRPFVCTRVSAEATAC